jgi:hypothetical protein
MATSRSKADQAPAVRPVFEVLTRRPDGHETVHRNRADDQADARRQVLDAGVPAEQIVEVVQVTAS